MTKHKRTPIGTYEKIARYEVGNGIGHTLYSVGVCTRYQACPKESHLITVKNIIDVRYISIVTKLADIFTKGLDVAD